jgi:hypothetical protein
MNHGHDLRTNSVILDDQPSRILDLIWLAASSGLPSMPDNWIVTLLTRLEAMQSKNDRQSIGVPLIARVGRAGKEDGSWHKQS